MSISTLAFLLLIGRAISIVFNVLVLRRQWKIRKIPTHPRLQKMRVVLSLLAVVVFTANLYPAWLDIVTLFDPGVRSTPIINLKGVIYSLDNNLGFMFASIFIWVLYKLADVAIDVGELIAGNPPKEVEVKPKSK